MCVKQVVQRDAGAADRGRARAAVGLRARRSRSRSCARSASRVRPRARSARPIRRWISTERPSTLPTRSRALPLAGRATGASRTRPSASPGPCPAGRAARRPRRSPCTARACRRSSHQHRAGHRWAASGAGSAAAGSGRGRGRRGAGGAWDRAGAGAGGAWRRPRASPASIEAPPRRSTRGIHGQQLGASRRPARGRPPSAGRRRATTSASTPATARARDAQLDAPPGRATSAARYSAPRASSAWRAQPRQRRVQLAQQRGQQGVARRDAAGSPASPARPASSGGRSPGRSCRFMPDAQHDARPRRPCRAPRPSSPPHLALRRASRSLGHLMRSSRAPQRLQRPAAATARAPPAAPAAAAAAAPAARRRQRAPRQRDPGPPPAPAAGVLRVGQHDVAGASAPRPAARASSLVDPTPASAAPGAPRVVARSRVGGHPAPRHAARRQPPASSRPPPRPDRGDAWAPRASGSLRIERLATRLSAI